MIDEGIKIPFRFYTDIENQNYKKRWCFDDLCSYKLLTNTKRLLPFQIKRISNPASITTFELYCWDDNVTVQMDLLSKLPSPYTSLFYLITIEGYDYLIYNATQDFTEDLPCGDFYVKVSDGDNTWYSEIITIRDFTDNEDTDDLLNINDTDVLEINATIDYLKIN